MMTKAVLRNHCEIVCTLLSNHLKTPDKNVVDIEGRSPLHYAAKLGNVRIVLGQFWAKQF